MEIKVIPYSTEIAKQLAPAMGEYSQDIIQGIKRGQSQIWQIGRTYFVVTIEEDSKGKVLVVLCATGQDLAQTAPRVREQANNIGAYGCRFHSTHKGLHRLIGLPTQWIEEVFLVPVEEAFNGK